MERKDAANIIFEVISKDIVEEGFHNECEFQSLLKRRNLNEIIRSLSTIPDDISIKGNTKVKTI